MKSEARIQLVICFQVLVIMLVPCRAAPESVTQVAVAALKLPASSEGGVHWRAEKEATTPIQLSTRYFSERLKVKGNIIRFYEKPVVAGQDEPLPEPFLSVRIPQTAGLVYVVLSATPEKNNGSDWQATLIRGDDWKAGCLRVHNASPEALGLSASNQAFKLPSGKFVDFHARQWKDPFAMKIYRFQPDTKLVFSSTWRVAPGRRELCFIASSGKSVKFRSLIEFRQPPPKVN